MNHDNEDLKFQNRRSQISDGIKKLQDLFPEIDKVAFDSRQLKFVLVFLFAAYARIELK